MEGGLLILGSRPRENLDQRDISRPHYAETRVLHNKVGPFVLIDDLVAFTGRHAEALRLAAWASSSIAAI